MIMTISQDEQGLFIGVEKWELRPTTPSGFKVHEQISVQYVIGYCRYDLDANKTLRN